MSTGRYGHLDLVAVCMRKDLSGSQHMTQCIVVAQLLISIQCITFLEVLPGDLEDRHDLVSHNEATSGAG